MYERTGQTIDTVRGYDIELVYWTVGAEKEIHWRGECECRHPFWIIPKRGEDPNSIHKRMESLINKHLAQCIGERPPWKETMAYKYQQLVKWVEKNMWKVDGGTYGSGYIICTSCCAIKDVKHPRLTLHRPDCELAGLLSLQVEK